jgi:hypothetical protein
MDIDNSRNIKLNESKYQNINSQSLPIEQSISVPCEIIHNSTIILDHNCMKSDSKDNFINQNYPLINCNDKYEKVTSIPTKPPTPPTYRY